MVVEILFNFFLFLCCIGEGERKVFELDLKGNRLNGHLPNVFSKLNTIKFLDFNASGLTGEIPWRTILFMGNLEVLNLSNNNFAPSVRASPYWLP